MVDDTSDTTSGGPSRRVVLTGLGGAGVGVGLGAAALGHSAARHEAIAPDEVSFSADEASACTLTPEQMEGPFYLDGKFIRRNMTEGKAGVSLTLTVKVVNATGCAPLKDVAVDLWQCDAEGAYSGYTEGGSDPTTTFLRGIQLSDSAGLAIFRTIYPGWYVGRAIHIHIKTHLGGQVVGTDYVNGHVAHTGQLYFPENFNAEIAATAPYSQSSDPRTPNAGDSIFTDGGAAGLVTVKRPLIKGQPAKGLTGRIQVSIDPNATPPVA
jgi:protocatechuate 3,4-dioxygenase beta subunit